MCRSCLSWYGRRIAPYLVHAGCSSDAFSRMRRRMVPHAKGVVVEVGFGSGLNLPYYDAAKVTRLIGVDPDGTMLALAKRRAMPFDVEYLQACGESMQLADGLADTVVVATSSRTPVLRGEWLSPGTHVNAVGACRPDWRELDDEAVRRARLFVDSSEAATRESGDVIAAGEVNAEIGEVTERLGNPS